jgi:hypothetical protein
MTSEDKIKAIALLMQKGICIYITYAALSPSDSQNQPSATNQSTFLRGQLDTRDLKSIARQQKSDERNTWDGMV